MRQMIGITIDNGGSEVRYNVSGSNEIKTFSNNFATIEPANFRVKDIEDKLSVCHVVKAPIPEYQKIIAYGPAAMQYQSTAINMRSGVRKTDSDSYYLQFIFAVARAIMEEELSNTLPVEEVGGFSKLPEILRMPRKVDTVITTLIPLREHSGDVDCVSKMKETLAGTYIVEFPLVESNITSLEFTIAANRLGVMPEDGIAMGAIKNQIEPTDYSIVIGMGHVTLDLAIYQGTQLCSSVKSETNAGSTLISLIKDALADNNHFVNEAMVGEIIKTGVVHEGKEKVDVSAIIEKQKQIFVDRYVKDSIIGILNSAKINAKQIQNVVPSGALMNPVNSTGDMITMIVNSCGLEKADVKIVADDLRYANIHLASKVTKVLLAQMA